MSEQLRCWSCGSALKDVILPLSRRQVCEHCNADQHVCAMCKYFNPAISGQCEEDRAEDVSNKESANFCDYFSPKPHAYQPKHKDKEAEARSKLDALFGSEDSKKTISNSANEKAKDGGEELSKADKAKKALEDLFGDNKD